MIIDSRSLPANETIETDVCIIGAGTAGITLAREFIGQEFKVCLLESGGLKPDQETQSLYWGKNIGHPYFSLDTARSRYFCGSSNRWWITLGDNCFGARMRPLDEIDFEKRDCVPYSGWPFRKSHLEPFYERAQAICKIEPSTFDVNYWENPEKTPRLPLNEDRVKTVIFKFGSQEPFTNNYPQEVIQAGNIVTHLYANAIEIETDDTTRTVTRLRVACLQGNKFSVSAKIFILAMGAIEIPRLLLLSNKKQSSGLGNQHDLVGKFFMEHLHFWSGIFVPTNQNIFKSTALYNNIHRINNVPILGKLALSEELIHREKLLNYVTALVPTIAMYSSLAHVFYPSIVSESVRSFRALRSQIFGGKLSKDVGKYLKNIINDIDNIKTTANHNIKRRLIRTFNKKKIKFFRLESMSEQIPNPESRVILSTDCDLLGQNCVHLDWRLSPIDIQSAIRTQEILDQELRNAGLGRLYIELNDETPPEVITGGWHHMGTTRMHVDPKRGVVDENCLVHGISNLFIAGPSVFPTSGYANPILTIVALTVRLAEHIKKLMKR